MYAKRWADMTGAKSLREMLKGEKGIVTGLTSEKMMKMRLRDIGLIEGTEVECLGKSPLGDPSAFLIRGAVIALRGEDACHVRIRKR